MSAVLSRRRFLFVGATAAGALLVGWKTGRADPSALPYLGARNEAQELGAFIRIEGNGDVIIGARSCEIGQGVKTSLPMLIAEELDIDWNRVRVEQLPYGYVETDNGPSNRYGGQGAGGSDNIPTGWKDRSMPVLTWVPDRSVRAVRMSAFGSMVLAGMR